MNTKNLKIAGHEITIKKLPIGKIVGLIESFKTLPPEIKDQFASWDANTKNEEFLFEHVPMMLTVSMPKVTEFVIKASNSEELTEEMLLNDFGIDDSLDLIMGIMEINNITGIIEKVKKIMALYATKSEKRINPMIKQ